MNTSDPAVLVVEDDSALREALRETLDIAGIPVRAVGGGEHALRELASEHRFGLVVSDVQMAPMDGYALLQQIRRRQPDLPVVMMTAHGTIEKAVRAMRDGAEDYLVKPFDARQLVALAQRFLRSPAAAEAGPVCVDPASEALLERTERVASTDATVLLTGESGCGKEVIARHLHRLSSRRNGPFVAINCAAIPESMLEATLFGHEKGAFTGASASHAGKFEQAQGGTLLLDEISEMALPLQAKLLRVLQEREVERIGGHTGIALDVRVIATSNRNLREAVNAGRFREDLYYRLNVIPLAIPPLRHRRGDILPLARHLLASHAGRFDRPTPTLTTAAQGRLLEHPWPGNVRELDNLMQRALILAGSNTLDADDLPFEGDVTPEAPGPAGSGANDLAGIVRQNEAQVILDALRQHEGNRRATAAELGVSERTLRYKLARLRADGLLAATPA